MPYQTNSNINKKQDSTVKHHKTISLFVKKMIILNNYDLFCKFKSQAITYNAYAA